MRESRKILLLEDDQNFGPLLKDYLQMKGFEAEWFVSGFKALSYCRQHDLDLCITDVMMPEMNGFEFVEQLRAFKPELPLIYLTARNEKSDQIRGFRTGADDYLCKPFDSELLVFKIEALLKRREKRHTTPKTVVYQLGALSFDVPSRKLKGEQEENRLSPKESQLLQILCEHLNEIMPREKALLKIWKDDTYFTRRSMDVYIAKLRKRFENVPQVQIDSLHSQGYILRVE